MDDNDVINNINKRLEELENKYELIKKENIGFKNALKINEQTIINLKIQIDLLKKENQMNIKQLKDYFFKEFKYLKQIKEKKEIFEKGKNEIIINGKNNNSIDIKLIHEDMEKMIDKKIQEFEIYFIKLLENNKIKLKNIKKTEEIKIEPQKKEKKKEKILINGKTIDELLLNKVMKILSEQSSDISIEDMNDLKKFCSTILINGEDPNSIISKFLTDNFINSNELEDTFKNNMSTKKIQIFDISNFLLLKEINAKDELDFIKQFREKYGITENDYPDKKLKKQIKKYKTEKDILKKILQKFKYLK